MWKRSENEPSAVPPPASSAVAPPTVTPTSSTSRPAPAPPPLRVEASTLGAGLSFNGQVSGEEDLTVEGTIEGKIELRKNLVRVGSRGRVKAEIVCRLADIAGQVEGNVVAEEQVLVRQSGSVRGNLTAPRVSLEDGAKFKGAIDMEPSTPKVVSTATADPKAAPKPQAAGVAP